MQIAVCDDEKEIRDMFAERIERLWPETELALYQSGEELLLAERLPDIVLLDICLPGRNGMETAAELRKKSRETVIIFVSALEDYVFQAFDVGAFHYLVKPFDDRKFEEVLRHAMEQAGQAGGRKRGEPAGGRKEKSSLVITAGGKHIAVNPEDIVYAEVYDRKVIIHTMDSDIEYYGKMKELEKMAGEEFYRPHRAYLVNFNFIRKYNASTIWLEKGQALMAKQNYRDFVQCYLRYNQRKGRE